MSKRFTTTIVRRPTPSMVNGITTAHLGKPDFNLALEQHANYIAALKQCGVEVVILEGDDQYPDACFIEDTALCTPHCAIIMNPGAPSRQGEEVSIKKVLADHYTEIHSLSPAASVEAGDIMMVGDHYYIGLSDRTNIEGANELIEILKKYGMDGSPVEMKEFLHLKTGLSYLENNVMCITGEFVSNPIFSSFEKVVVESDEEYSANCIWVNDTVIIPKGYPNSQSIIESKGYKTIVVDVSEFQKLDGGLSCLSLRF